MTDEYIETTEPTPAPPPKLPPEGSRVFHHPRSIARGKGRVLYSEHLGAWVLPGGKTTTSEAWAVVIADRLHTIAERAGK